MASADELKALGNKAIAEKNFDDAVYVETQNLFLSYSLTLFPSMLLQ